MNDCDGFDVSNTEEKSSKCVTKRRSSIFRIQITFDQEDGINKNVPCTESIVNLLVDSSQQCPSGATKTESLNLQTYIQNLKEERQTWRNELKDRRSKRRILAKQKAIVERSGQTLDLSVLSNSNKTFLKTRPNYQLFLENAVHLSDFTVKTAILSQIITNLKYRLTTKMQNNLQNMTKRVIEMSEL